MDSRWALRSFWEGEIGWIGDIWGWEHEESVQGAERENTERDDWKEGVVFWDQVETSCKGNSQEPARMTSDNIYNRQKLELTISCD